MNPAKAALGAPLLLLSVAVIVGALIYALSAVGSGVELLAVVVALGWGAFEIMGEA